MTHEQLIERILNKLDEIVKEQALSREIQAENTASLKEHVKRSDSLEKHLEIVREELKPVQKHVYYVEGALKLLGGISVGIGIVWGIVNITSSIIKLLD